MAVNTWGESLNTWNSSLSITAQITETAGLFSDSIAGTVITNNFAQITEANSAFVDSIGVTIREKINGNIIETNFKFSDSITSLVSPKWTKVNPSNNSWINLT